MYTPIITQTPMRITLGGGGTDVLWYSKLRGGAWISAAINKYVYIFLNKTDDPDVLKIFDGSDYYVVNNISEIKNPIVYECLKLSGVKNGLQITTISEISGRSGLGGSGAFEIGLLNALFTFQKRRIPPLKLGNQAADIEIKKLKKSVGPQDQLIAAIGGMNYFEIDKKGRVKVEPLKLSKPTIKGLETNLLYFSTRINRDAEAVLGDQKKKVEKDPEKSAVIESLDSIKELGQRVKRYLLNGEINKFGQSLHEHWLIKKTLSGKMSNSKIDYWYEKGIDFGALGGKIMGAGGGGWFVFYVNKHHEGFKNKMNKIGLISQDVKFDFKGTRLLT
ncbi:hypothetical protein A3F00_02405 [Candidatus Daviesbacteria bacterium RIFCSPHIGHO2_12_FULL_37_11]|uniref:GHMP kinase N-terminal domain-containing protein n=1 Tax=Candidatus Daviesbacteria bacterium RIFCSPHIGHO2_12_FULL_37_11 TaxID=1797777 RepID=A0A1F5K8I2_9BACT|nr:MAG: hypothetical protein A2769_00240 [Candidatus Daviesbacteria bacterium RIFCSPHIGHO2_01_FULL_37_27]OGE37253.1 MAG: hypothetical protein A3F00_02405 [Candidatus Daviesbacteria bacterium RIFCSPHIGHO2_12_FULL_37_11]OGE46127.1 MAG: hypothetical protein A3B39_00860 [Candidatus Daviesbacteria bacterium RIFCSPLOWO2_01_FULL_37_10]